MFYVKERISDIAELKIEITDENVYCTCPKCGSEVLVDIADIFKDSEADLFGTAVYCKDCSKLTAKEED